MKRFWLVPIIALLFTIAFCNTPALAEVNGPGWISGTAESVSPSESKAYYQAASSKSKEADSLFSANDGPILAYSSTTVTPEIAELARALHNDPKLIYNYVHNNIDYIPYLGSLKGATLTLLDKSGNDFDQASLMIALLRESGYTANFIYGAKYVPGPYFANWLGVDLDINIVWSVLGSGGIPVQVYIYDSISVFTLIMDRVWVKATINGIDYVFDPSDKSYSYTSKIDIGTATGYNRADLLSAASAGATVDSNSVQNLNQSNLNSKISEYTANLIDTLRSQYPNSDISDIFGGRKIVKMNLSEYQTTLPDIAHVDYTWTDVPESYTAKLRIQHQGIDHTIQVPEIAGKRLTLTYAGSGLNPELRLDGTLIASGTATTRGSIYDVIITINHPYANNSGTYADQTATYKCTSGSTYAIVSDFGGTTDSLILKREKQLSQNIAAGLSDTSEPILGETLAIMGSTWMKEVQSADNIITNLAENICLRHHRVGLMAQESGYYIDVKQGFVSTISRHGASSLSHFNSIGTLCSAFEHGVLEQMMGSDKPGASTIKLLHLANNQGNKIFWANSGNFAGIQPQLHGYSSQALSDIQNYINAGRTVILPEDGALAINQWRGAGFITRYVSADGFSCSLGMIISGGYFGGYGSTPGYVAPGPIANNVQITIPDISYDIETPTVQSSEPVDMATGAYLYDRTDIALGEKAPMGIGFSRSYNSSRKYNKRSVGNAWQHSYDIFVKKLSDGNPVLGLRSPVDAAAMITDLYIALDLMVNEDNIMGWTTMCMAHKWAVDQTIDNAVSVNLGGQMAEFIKLPDSTYNGPTGITTELVDNGNGTFSLEERFGAEMDFDTGGKISQLKDIDGNILSFTYSGDKLTTVHDAVGRSLALDYAGANISTVTDSSGRSVSYVYDANNDLISYTDVAGKIWTYGYDTQHQMTSLNNPLEITTATNIYDTLGRVRTQVVPRQGPAGTTATYNFYFSGFRNVEEDPFGKRTVYYLDEKSRTYAVEDALLSKTVKTFDGQNHAVTVKDARLNVATFSYDGNQNLIKIKNALNKETDNAYDSDFRLTDITDPLSHTSHFDYDADHHLTQTTDAESNTSSLDYYPNGKVSSATDGRGVVTTLAYDSYNFPLTTNTASHPAVTYSYDPIGRMLRLTDQERDATNFTYDARGLLLTRTDPLLKVTRFVYDDVGRMTSRTDRNNYITTYTYTPTDKLDTITYPGGLTVTFTYNLHDKLIRMQDSTGTTIYTHDDVYRIKTITDPHNQLMSYEYDAVGNITKIIYPGNKDIIYTYDALNHLKTVTNWLSQTAAYNYDDAGRLLSLTNFNGTVTSYAYDDANRLSVLENKADPAGKILSSYAYTLDGNGNRTQILQQEPLATIAPLGNIDYIYNSVKNRLLSAGPTNFTYDDEGRLSSMGSTSYQFDYEHRLTNISGSVSSQFIYDGRGNRLEATRNGTTIRYIYDARGNILAEADSSNNVTRYYVYGLGLLSMVTPVGETYTYHYNGIGSTIAVTDQNKNVVNKYSYTPFGIITSSQETIPQPFTYAGQYGVMYEPCGLYYMRARYYDADTGRFISEDPSGFEGGINLYAYCNSNPVNFVDPSGLDTYYIDNKIGKSVPTNNPVSHSFVATTDIDPNTGREVVTNTYSWTNEGGGSWHANEIQNRVGAQVAINSGVGVERWGNESLDPYVASQYENRQGDTGGYSLVANNCKHNASSLLTDAISQKQYSGANSNK